MRYNKEVYDYDKYIEEMKKESKIQNELYKRIGITRNKIKKIEQRIPGITSKLQVSSCVKDLINLNKDIDKYSKELEYSKDRYHFFEQKVCAHDFGLIINSYYDSENKRTINNGICLECGAELNDIDETIFDHSIVLNEETVGVYNLEDYKSKLEMLKKRYNYYNTNYDFELGERIVNEMTEDAKSLKKKYGRL